MQAVKSHEVVTNCRSPRGMKMFSSILGGAGRRRRFMNGTASPHEV